VVLGGLAEAAFGGAVFEAVIQGIDRFFFRRLGPDDGSYWYYWFFDRPPESRLLVLGGVVLVALRYYLLLKAYSHVARGLSRAAGVPLPASMRWPLLSRDLASFWRRYNVTISRFAEDHVLKPVAASTRPAVAVAAAFLFMGLWHRPAWHTAAWAAAQMRGSRSDGSGARSSGGRTGSAARRVPPRTAREAAAVVARSRSSRRQCLSSSTSITRAPSTGASSKTGVGARMIAFPISLISVNLHQHREVSGDLVGAGVAAEVARRGGASALRRRRRKDGGRRGRDRRDEPPRDGGITEPIFALPALARALGAIRRRVRTQRPSAALLIGNDVFNVLLGRWFRRQGIPTLSYMPPQIWIWRSLARPIAGSFDEILTSFPSEQEVYSATGARSTFVGHYLADALARPTRDEAARHRRRFGIPPESRVVGLLPGSRVHEVRPLAPILLDAARRLLDGDPALRFLIPLADPVYARYVEEAARARGMGERIVFCGESQDAMRACDVLAVASGTATLEAALLGVPMVIVYRVSAFTMAVVRACIRLGLIDSETVGLPNLLAGRAFVPELRNRRATAENVAREVEALLRDPFRRREMDEGFREVASGLAGEGAFEAQRRCSRAPKDGRPRSARRGTRSGARTS
jgi:lipid-A-disaccharide synthase